jgi:hypothetical protein
MPKSKKKSATRKSELTKPVCAPPTLDPDDGFVVQRWRDDSEGRDLLGIDFNRTGDGEKASVCLDMAAQDKPSVVAAELLNRGAELPPDRRDREALLASLISRVPEHAGVLASRSGWHGSAFLLGSRPPYGATDDLLRMKPAIIAANPHMGRVKGPSADWRKHVATPAQKSSIVSFAIMAALAAPISRFAQLDEGVVFNFCGPSSTGKTTALHAALSVAGSPQRPLDWNLTDRALYEIATAHSDLPLVLDDLERFRHDSGTRAASLSKRLHTLTGGQSTHYAASVQSSLPKLEWQPWGFSSSPLALHEEFARNRAEPSPGDLGRWIDLVVSPARQGGVWDMVAIDETAPSSSLLSENLKSAAARYYGWPMRRWLPCLVAIRKDLPLVVTQLVERFVGHACPNASEVERRVARKIGVVFAAGLMAVGEEILPWTDQHVLAVCTAIYERSRYTRQQATFDPAQAHATLLAATRDEAIIPIVPENQGPRFPDGANITGFRQTRGGVDVIFILQSYLEGLYGPAFDALMAELGRRKGLLGGQGGKSTSQERIYMGNVRIKKRFLRLDSRRLQELIVGTNLL